YQPKFIRRFHFGRSRDDRAGRGRRWTELVPVERGEDRRRVSKKNGAGVEQDPRHVLGALALRPVDLERIVGLRLGAEPGEELAHLGPIKMSMHGDEHW